MEFIKKEVNGNTIYLREKKGKYRVVYPIKNEDGSWNWKNMISGGDWWNLVWVTIFIVVALGCIFEYISNIRIGAECLAREATANAITNSLGGLPL